MNGNVRLRLDYKVNVASVLSILPPLSECDELFLDSILNLFWTPRFLQLSFLFFPWLAHIAIQGKRMSACPIQQAGCFGDTKFRQFSPELHPTSSHMMDSVQKYVRDRQNIVLGVLLLKKKKSSFMEHFSIYKSERSCLFKSLSTAFLEPS